MIDTFYIGAYWRNRKELLNRVVNPTLQTLRELSEVDKQFLNLYELGMSRQQALEHRISLTPEYIERLYRGRVKKNDLDQDGYNKIGYRLSLWTGHKEGEASTISFNAGSSSKRLTDLCLINLPSEGAAKNRLLQLDKVKEIIKLLIRNWNPDTVVLNSKELSEALDTMNELGWVTYTKNVKTWLKLSDNIVHEKSFFGGHLFYLKTENNLAYDYNLISQLLSVKKEVVT